MRFLLAFLLALGLGFCLQSYLPFWILSILGFLIGFAFALRGSFLCGFLSGFLLWGGMAYFLDHGNAGELSTRVAAMFQLPAGWAIIVVTALLGGLLAGISMWAGVSTRKLFAKR